MADYNPEPKGLENLATVFNQGGVDLPHGSATGVEYFNTFFTPSQNIEKNTFFFGGVDPTDVDITLAETAKQSLEDRFKDSNTFGVFGGTSSPNIWTGGDVDGEGNFPYFVSNFQPTKTDGINTTNWSELYNNTHTTINNTGYHYSNYVGRDRLNIRFGGDPSSYGGTMNSRAQGINSNSGAGGQGEPYIVSNIARSISDGESGRNINFGSREMPFTRSTTDFQRISKFLLSPAGLEFAIKQQALGVQGVTIVNKEGHLKTKRQYKAFYNPLSTAIAVGPITRFLGYGPNNLIDREFPVGEITDDSSDKYGINAIKNLKPMGEKFTNTSPDKLKSGYHQNMKNIFGQGLKDVDEPENLDFFEGFFSNIVDTFEGNITKEKNHYGDPHTLMPIKIDGEYRRDKQKNIFMGTRTEPYGMPFYFKDLRDNRYIVFRGYIDGLTENLTPTCSSTNYVGRSEPVYVYEQAERAINFNLKIFAQTREELSKIYRKINKLTSLVYPEYHVDNVSYVGGKTRMKPPLTQLRIGDLFGERDNELTGFIRSLTYTFPDEGVWETEHGRRVPKYVTAQIDYAIIHNKVPELNTDFYGFNY